MQIAFQNNKSNLDIKANSFKQKIVLKGDQFSSQITKINCLELKVFDKSENLYKHLEVYLVELLENDINSIIQYAKDSQHLMRSDLFLKVYNSYFLDNEQIFYVVEYEDFDFSYADYLSKKIIIENHDRNSFDKYLEAIFNQSYQALTQGSLKDIHFISLKQQCQFVFIKQNDSKFTLKLNTVHPYLYIQAPNYSIVHSKCYSSNQQTILEQKDTTPQILIQLSPFHNISIKKEDLMKFIQDYCQIALEYHHNSILDLINIYPQYESFVLEKVNDNQLILQAKKGEKLVSIKILKCEQIDKAENLKKQYERLKQLNSKNISTIITNFEVINKQSYSYTITELDYSLMDESQGLAQYLQDLAKSSQILQKMKWLIEILELLIVEEIPPSCLYIRNESEIIIKKALIDEIPLSDSLVNNVLAYTDIMFHFISYNFCGYFQRNLYGSDRLGETEKTCIPSLKQVLQIFSNYFESKRDKREDSNSREQLNSFLTQMEQLMQYNSNFNFVRFMFSQGSIEKICVLRKSSALLFKNVKHDDIYEMMKIFSEKSNFDSIDLEYLQLLAPLQQQALYEKYSEITEKIETSLPLNLPEQEITDKENIQSVLRNWIDISLDTQTNYFNESQKNTLKEMTINSIEDQYDIESLKLKASPTQAHNRWMCCVPLITNFNSKELRKIIISNISVLKLKEIFGESFHSGCQKEDVIQFANLLQSNQKTLSIKEIYIFDQCQGITQQLKEKPDYFQLKDNPQITEFHMYQKFYSKEIIDQLLKYPNKINTLRVQRNFSNFFASVKVQKKTYDFQPFYKINRLVNLKYL